MQVDGVPLCGFSNQEAVEILKRTSQTVKLKIVRYLRGLKFEELQEGVGNASTVTPSTTTPISPSEAMNKVPGNQVRLERFPANAWVVHEFSSV